MLNNRHEIKKSRLHNFDNEELCKFKYSFQLQSTTSG